MMGPKGRLSFQGSRLPLHFRRMDTSCEFCGSSRGRYLTSQHLGGPILSRALKGCPSDIDLDPLNFFWSILSFILLILTID